MTIEFGLPTQKDEAVMDVLDPSTNLPMKAKDGTAVTLTVCGIDSEHYRKAKRKLTDKKIASMRGRSAPKLSAAEIEEEALSLLAMNITAWTGFTDGGKPADCNTENVMTVLRKCPFIVEQVERFMEDRANYFLN